MRKTPNRISNQTGEDVLVKCRLTSAHLVSGPVSFSHLGPYACEDGLEVPGFSTSEGHHENEYVTDCVHRFVGVLVWVVVPANSLLSFEEGVA